MRILKQVVVELGEDYTLNAEEEILFHGNVDPYITLSKWKIPL